MTTKKDLVEAHSFSRRRLVTAFLSGAPGGREVEPSRPGRTIFGGIAVAVLLIAGAAIASVLAPKDKEGWDEQGLAVTEQGTRYVITGDDSLRPVLNLASAQLILGLEPETSIVSQDEIDEQGPGGAIGIKDAPERLPGPDDFVSTGWTACTDHRRGVQLSIASDPGVTRDPSVAFLVEASGSTWLIAQADPDTQALRYRLPDRRGALDSVLFDSEVGAEAISVPASWLHLFDEGDPISARPFDVAGSGPSSAAPVGADAGAGDVVRYGGVDYLLTRDDSVRLTPVESEVYRALVPSAQLVETGAAPASAGAELDPAPNWPASRPTAPNGAVCAELDAADGARGGVVVATSPTKQAWDETAPPRSGANVQAIEAGKGAFFFSGDGATPYIVDSLGAAYLVDGPQTLTHLGLGADDGPILGGGWVELFDRGTPLSTELALCPPDTKNVTRDQCVKAP